MKGFIIILSLIWMFQKTRGEDFGTDDLTKPQYSSADIHSTVELINKNDVEILTEKLEETVNPDDSVVTNSIIHEDTVHSEDIYIKEV